MHSEPPSEFVQPQHNTPLSSPLSVSNRSSPLSASQNAPRDTCTSPLSIPDTTRSPSSTTTSTPHSPLTPVNSSPRSFRSTSSQYHSDSHSLASASPLSISSSASMPRLASGLGTALFVASPTGSRLNGLAEEFATPVIGSLHNILPNSLATRAQLNALNPAATQPTSYQTPSSETQQHDVVGLPLRVRDFANSQAIAPASPHRTATTPGSTTDIARPPNSTATSAVLPPSSPLRSPISVDSFASPNPSLLPSTNVFSPSTPSAFSIVVEPSSSDTGPKSFQRPHSFTLDRSQPHDISSASPATPPHRHAQPKSSIPPSVAPGSSGSQGPFSPPQHQQPGPTTASSRSETSTSDADFRTPNVYINGLPPNFPEDELFKMTRDFGIVVSVRTFTRHVCDKPSGYGFVLFETVDAAEKCIEALRKYRNLHPSFSKQIHKIPGTIYSSPSFQSVANAQGLPADSFKARMEQLKDTSSTNLYMEGLPLSIDDVMMAALVRPYKICSSRFFQTKLSDPPRMIAFVRLESRAAAEEIVERLHGRVIRLDDTGTRISVRFADTTEQRELRRLERTNRDGEQSPGRISMAQAALLNMKGNQVHPSQLSPLVSPELSHIQPSAAVSPLLTGHLTPSVGRARTPISPMNFQQQQAILQQRIRDHSLTRHGYDDFSSNASPYLCQDLIAPQLAQVQEELRSLQEAQARLQLKRGFGAAGAGGIGAATRADSGYTPMEKMLLQAHAHRQQQEQQILEAQIHAQAQRGLAGRGQRRLLDALQSTSIEDDFHTSATMLANSGAYLSSQTGVGQAGAGMVQRQRNQTHGSNARVAELPHTGLGQALHLRSTTMPSQYLNSRSLERNGGGLDRSASIAVNTGNAFSVASMNASNAFARKPSLPAIQGLSSSNLPRTTNSTATQGHGQGVGRGAMRELDVGGDEDGPGLTFSPKTPATLSPATPFGGFFHPGESFDGSGMVGVGERGMSMAHHDASVANKKASAVVAGGMSIRGLHA